MTCDLRDVDGPVGLSYYKFLLAIFLACCWVFWKPCHCEFKDVVDLVLHVKIPPMMRVWISSDSLLCSRPLLKTLPHHQRRLRWQLIKYKWNLLRLALENPNQFSWLASVSWQVRQGEDKTTLLKTKHTPNATLHLCSNCMRAGRDESSESKQKSLIIGSLAGAQCMQEACRLHKNQMTCMRESVACVTAPVRFEATSVETKSFFWGWAKESKNSLVLMKISCVPMQVKLGQTMD